MACLACTNAESPTPATTGGTAGTAGPGGTTTGTATHGAATGTTSSTGVGAATGTGGLPSTATGSGESGGSTGANVTGTSSGTGGTGGGGTSTVVPGAEGFNCEPADGSPVNTKLTKLVGDLPAPVGVYGPPGELDRLFIPLLGGRIEILRGNSITGTFLDISDKVDVDDAAQYEERGLLGMAFHPEFQDNGKFFVFYTTGSADYDNLVSHVSEFTASGDSVDPATEREFLQFPNPENNHNGGGMTIGLDGHLYVGVGDGGWSGTAAADLYDNGQNPGTPLGALLRFTLDGQPAPGNYPGGAAEVWDIGLRNPWRVTADGCTGDLYIADVGYEGEHEAPPTEEVNVEPPQAGHKNYGWPVMEGSNCRESGCDMSPLVLPTDSYPTLSGGAIIGGYVYRGSNIPGLRGTYMYADYAQGTFWAFEYQNGVAANSREITSDINPDTFNTGLMITFGQDSAGEIYLIAWTDGGREGMDGMPAPVNIGDVYRIDPE